MAAEKGPVVDLSGLCTQIDDTIDYIQQEDLTLNDVEAACKVVEKVVKVVLSLANLLNNTEVKTQAAAFNKKLRRVQETLVISDEELTQQLSKTYGAWEKFHQNKNQLNAILAFAAQKLNLKLSPELISNNTEAGISAVAAALSLAFDASNLQTNVNRYKVCLDAAPRIIHGLITHFQARNNLKTRTREWTLHDKAYFEYRYAFDNLA